MKTQSAKAKGRNLQKWVRDQLIEQLEIHPEDIESRSMGAGGEDLIMARAARSKFPFSVECKNVEKLNVWEAYEQAKSNCNGYEPIVVMKKNHKKPLVVIDAEYFNRLTIQHLKHLKYFGPRPNRIPPETAHVRPVPRPPRPVRRSCRTVAAAHLCA